MHPARLGERVPSSEQISIASVRGYVLRFHKRGQDGSAKCNMLYTGESDDVVHGVIYSMCESERGNLDHAEGLGKGYNIQQMTIATTAGTHKVFCYIAEQGAIDETLKPFDWYKALVVRAVEHQRFPERYIEQIRQVETIADPDRDRADKHFRLAHSL